MTNFLNTMSQRSQKKTLARFLNNFRTYGLPSSQGLCNDAQELQLRHASSRHTSLAKILSLDLLWYWCISFRLVREWSKVHILIWSSGYLMHHQSRPPIAGDLISQPITDTSIARIFTGRAGFGCRSPFDRNRRFRVLQSNPSST